MKLHTNSSTCSLTSLLFCTPNTLDPPIERVYENFLAEHHSVMLSFLGGSLNLESISSIIRSFQCAHHILLLELLAGTAIVTETKAALWTDGRYHLQAEKQLDSNWTLMRDGMFCSTFLTKTWTVYFGIYTNIVHTVPLQGYLTLSLKRTGSFRYQ